MAEARLIDYYSILNIPGNADLMGVENAYARLSSEMAERAQQDETSVEALKRLNEAYAVLSKPNLRAEYDAMFFKSEREEKRRRTMAELRRKALVGNAVAGALALVVAGQAVLLGYLAREQVGEFFGFFGF